MASSAATTINLVSNYPEIVYCKDDEDDPYNTTQCRRNGISTTNPFLLQHRYCQWLSERHGLRVAFFTPARPGRQSVLLRHPAARALFDCRPSAIARCPATPTGNYVHPAPVRYCQNTTDANSFQRDFRCDQQPAARCQRTYTTNHTRHAIRQFSPDRHCVVYRRLHGTHGAHRLRLQAQRARTRKR